MKWPRAMHNKHPECQSCDGHCCREFDAKVAHDRKPWSRKRAEKEMAKCAPPYEQTGESRICGNEVVIPVRCTAFTDDGKCSIYETRPDACKAHPSQSEIRRNDKDTDCPLIERLRREAKDALRCHDCI